MPTVDEIRDWAGRDAIGSDDDKIGKIDHLYVDRQTGEPTFAAIKTGLFGGNDTLVPVEGAKRHGDHVHVAYTKDKVKDAPNVEADDELTEAEEGKLYEHYGIGGYSQYEGEDHATVTDYDRDRSGAGARDTSGKETDDGMTRSEEELRVGTTQRETGKARLRKYIVTETVTQTVPVSREEVGIEREPITEQIESDGDIDTRR